MTDRLSLYNGALQIIGNRKLTSLSESRESRRTLDTVWNAGAVKYCLEQGLWQFAARSMQMDYDPSFTASFGYSYAFAKPSDYVRTAKVCTDEDLQCPLLYYTDEVGYWFADLQTIYVQIVSNHADYGGDLSGWPESFRLFVEQYLAWKICFRLTKSRTRTEEIKQDMRRALIDARSKDAMREPVKFLPKGSWSSARMGRGSFNAVLPST
jgi:hypothetical protein